MGVRGEEVGSQLILIGNISVRDQCVQVSQFFCCIYPQYEFKVIFQVAYSSSDPHGASLRGDFFLLFWLYKTSPLKYQTFIFGHSKVVGPLKASLGSFVEFLLKFGPFSPKNWQRTSFFWQTNIHTYSKLTFFKFKFNFLQVLFLHIFPIKASLWSFVEFLLKSGAFFHQKLIKSIIFLAN